ncbi:unnamed protein product, partial [Durusdinium trenchii]
DPPAPVPPKAEQSTSAMKQEHRAARPALAEAKVCEGNVVPDCLVEFCTDHPLRRAVRLPHVAFGEDREMCDLEASAVCYALPWDEQKLYWNLFLQESASLNHFLDENPEASMKDFCKLSDKEKFEWIPKDSVAHLAVVSRYQSVLAYVASRGGCDSPDSDSSDNEFPEASGSKEDGASDRGSKAQPPQPSAPQAKRPADSLEVASERALKKDHGSKAHCRVQPPFLPARLESDSGLRARFANKYQERLRQDAFELLRQQGWNWDSDEENEQEKD